MNHTGFSFDCAAIVLISLKLGFKRRAELQRFPPNCCYKYTFRAQNRAYSSACKRYYMPLHNDDGAVKLSIKYSGVGSQINFS